MIVMVHLISRPVLIGRRQLTAAQYFLQQRRCRIVLAFTVKKVASFNSGMAHWNFTAHAAEWIAPCPESWPAETLLGMAAEWFASEEQIQQIESY